MRRLCSAGYKVDCMSVCMVHVRNVTCTLNAHAFILRMDSASADSNRFDLQPPPYRKVVWWNGLVEHLYMSFAFVVCSYSLLLASIECACIACPNLVLNQFEIRFDFCVASVNSERARNFLLVPLRSAFVCNNVNCTREIFFQIFNI